eukprot:CAMPEP_0203777634 /NCGR_PEP_ID=MMETSP0099_2-20121227/7491_1 /ASSEMBLY_ACC=CAM_ASM_000209 /TAXON_ID=96639 /ORGANISM=" , Strain NY0313808BC1" /LENGTH=164 /DNA_ID=CAMNT_0050676935 /DNA_START=96 /DNA_END=586 /DNA_ORIENTATION=-
MQDFKFVNVPSGYKSSQYPRELATAPGPLLLIIRNWNPGSFWSIFAEGLLKYSTHSKNGTGNEQASGERANPGLSDIFREDQTGQYPQEVTKCKASNTFSPTKCSPTSPSTRAQLSPDHIFAEQQVANNLSVITECKCISSFSFPAGRVRNTKLDELIVSARNL